MKAEIIKIYTEELPQTRFIGKKYGINNQIQHSFSHLWDQWFNSGWFEQIEKSVLLLGLEKEWFHESGSYIGLEIWNDAGFFEYWIGMFTPARTMVPENMEFLDFSANKLGVGWVHGTMDNIFEMHEIIKELLITEGYIPIINSDGNWISFERYNCPRFTTPDRDHKLVLDYAYFIKS